MANGVTMLSDEMDYINRKLRLFEGPEGITLELVQWALRRFWLGPLMSDRVFGSSWAPSDERSANIL